MATITEFRFNITGPQVEQVFNIPEGSTLIGRSPENNLMLPHGMVSRRHAQLTNTGQECTLEDQGSANGTLLNGTPLTPNVAVTLAEGARIKIGPFELVFHQQVVVLPEPEPESEPEPEVKGEPEDLSAVEQLLAEPIADRLEGDEPTPPLVDQTASAPDMSEPNLPEDGFVLPPGLEMTSRFLLNYLPPIYHTDFMSRFLALFESILMPSAWTIQNFDLFLSPATAPTSFLPWLANWFNLAFDDSWTEDQRRALLSEAGTIYSRLGTRWALSRLLEIYTGCSPEIIEFADNLDPHTFLVRLPAKGHPLDRELVERLIDASKPAHTTYRLEIEL